MDSAPRPDQTLPPGLLARGAGFPPASTPPADGPLSPPPATDFPASPGGVERWFHAETPTAPLNLIDQPLLEAAEPVLVWLLALRTQASPPQIEPLRHELVQAVRTFENRVISLGFPNEDMLTARYILCAFLDETILTSSWGSHSHWSSNSLLNQFHQEAQGGEKMFQIAGRLFESPERYRDLLLLIVTCLDLGFEGQYRVQNQGQRHIDALREQIHDHLRTAWPDPGKTALSSLAGVVHGPGGLVRYIPIWAVWCTALVLLTLIYSIFEFSIEAMTHDVLIELDRIGQPADPS